MYWFLINVLHFYVYYTIEYKKPIMTVFRVNNLCSYKIYVFKYNIDTFACTWLMITHIIALYSIMYKIK